MSEEKEKTGQISELKTQLVDCQDSLQNLVFQKSMQQLEDISPVSYTHLTLPTTPYV